MAAAGKIMVTCTGCGETFEAPAGLVGARCGSGQVRPATDAEVAARYGVRRGLR